MSWDVARKQVRNLETRLDAALNRYSRVAGDLSKVSSSSNWPSQSDDEGRKLPVDVDEGQKLETELEQMLTELANAVERLASALDAQVSMQSSATQQHALQRHREVLLDYERDYRRSRANVQKERDRAGLLGSVRVDIDSYKARFGSDTEALLAERSRLDNSHAMIDGTLDQAYATRADLSQQRSTLVDMTARMTSTASQIPGLNNLIRLIHRRRQRDRVIMGCVLGTCTVLLLMYITR